MRALFSVQLKKFFRLGLGPFDFGETRVQLVNPSDQAHLSRHCLEDLKKPLNLRLSEMASQFGGEAIFTCDFRIWSSWLGYFGSPLFSLHYLYNLLFLIMRFKFYLVCSSLENKMNPKREFQNF